MSFFGGRDGHRQVWRLAWPMILSNLTVPLLGLVDTAVVGHLASPEHLGAVAVGALIFNFIYFGCNFLRMGTTGLTAQSFGRGEANEVRATLARALLVAGAIAGLLLVLQDPIGSLAFALIGASDTVASHGSGYFFARVWGAPATLANIALIGWFVGMQNTRPALVLLVAVNGINMVLDVAFVVWLDMGVRGIAWATVIADYSGCLLGLAMVPAQLRQLGGQLTDVFAPARLRRLLTVNTDIFLRTFCVILAFAIFTVMGARHGDIVLAANAVLMNFVVFLNFGFDGFAHAAEALTGRAYGAGDRKAFSRAVRVSMFWCAAAALLTTAVYGVAGGGIVRLLTDIQPVRAMALDYLPWVIGVPLAAVWAILLDGVFTGTTRTKEMRNTMALALVAFLLVIWLAPGALGNHGLWLGVIVLYIVRGLGLGFSYWRIERRGGFIAHAALDRR